MRSDISKGNDQQLPETEKDASVYELLKGRLRFTDEPQWVRIILFLIMALFFIGAFWILKGTTIFTFLSRKLKDKWQVLLNR